VIKFIQNGEKEVFIADWWVSKILWRRVLTRVILLSGSIVAANTWFQIDLWENFIDWEARERASQNFCFDRLCFIYRPVCRDFWQNHSKDPSNMIAPFLRNKLNVKNGRNFFFRDGKFFFQFMDEFCPEEKDSFSKSNFWFVFSRKIFD